ncbi:hypothetical protein ABB37_01233 [Leptomonas pyrrhocoris]|uniref:Uncharacterized protein n=1 Tax=Leptomonas pyrrhocoris TaxID=157538 RepID=A0A0M9G8D0_LEPPY|nr:hypothetical protein ABB37_01233 [Leptomonas pyrrhocoris]KPA84737.1 hypothetical protein ABB37_01233 [Leptomonas pyrrhocoris]|eukprot:XP_015663176.1 hypothetical protein ABB37_01233 [Leptomonas pyrrhocoris]
MSTARRARERNAHPKAETYSRADEALWDDEYLLKLFNEQLENSAAVSDAAHPDINDRSNETSVSASETEDDGECSSTDSTTSSKSSVNEKNGATKSAAEAAASDLGGLQLPDDVKTLVQSFYRAGFEAGRYVGRTETAGQKSRKRRR